MKLAILFLLSFSFLSTAMNGCATRVSIDEQTVRRSQQITHHHKPHVLVPDASTSSSSSDEQNKGQFIDLELGKQESEPVQRKSTGGMVTTNAGKRLSLKIRLGEINPDQVYHDMAETSVDLFFGEGHQMHFIIGRVREKIKKIHADKSSPREHREQLEKLAAISDHRKTARSENASEIVSRIHESQQNAPVVRSAPSAQPVSVPLVSQSQPSNASAVPIPLVQQPQRVQPAPTTTTAAPASSTAAPANLEQGLSSVLTQGVPIVQEIVSQALADHNVTQTRIKYVSWFIGVLGTGGAALLSWLGTSQASSCPACPTCPPA